MYSQQAVLAICRKIMVDAALLDMQEHAPNGSQVQMEILKPQKC